MYKALFRPVLFLIDPEIIHHLVVFLVSLLNKIPGINKAVKSYLTYNHPLLRTTIAGIEFPNKVGMAAGFDKNAEFYNGLSLLLHCLSPAMTNPGFSDCPRIRPLLTVWDLIIKAWIMLLGSY
jgi:hypothetical protein